jgi:thioredoxin reductase
MWPSAEREEMTPVKRAYDVVVVGGGAAGLAGAVGLLRARRSVLVIDAGQPRNAPAAQVHSYLAREGVSPAELLATGRDEVIRYGGEIRSGRVTAASREGDGLLVTVAGGETVRARRLLVATGLVDELPDLPGLAQRWADPTGATTVPGVWVAGNVAFMLAQVVTAAATGLNAAVAINADLIDEDTRTAVAAHRRR